MTEARTDLAATCKDAIRDCEFVKDFVLREILVKIFDDTHTHIDWFEKQIDLMDEISLQNYQQSAVGSVDA